MEDNNKDPIAKAQEKDASLQQDAIRQPDALSMTDSSANAASDNLTQNVSGGSEIAPEYGDAQDPAFEMLTGGHHRDE